MRGQAVHSLDGGKGEVANGVAATGEPVEMARLTLTHPKSTERHDVTVSEPITERTMVQAGAVMTTQKRKELTYVPRLENPVSSERVERSYRIGLFLTPGSRRRRHEHQRHGKGNQPPPHCIFSSMAPIASAPLRPFVRMTTPSPVAASNPAKVRNSSLSPSCMIIV